MALDRLASRLQELLRVGSLPASRLTAAMRARLQTLLHIKALEFVKSTGGGQRVVLNDPAALLAWIASQYPSGLDGTDEDLPPRAESVANFRDSKSGRPLEVSLVYMRGFRDSVLRRGEVVMPLAELTRAYGLAGVLVDLSEPWTMEGVLGIIENLEVFLNVERAIPGLDAVIWAAGRLHTRVIDWLKGQEHLSVIHAGDYDPVGLDEYSRVKAALGDRAELHIPVDLRERCARYGQTELIVRSLAVYKRIRREGDDRVQQVLASLDRRGRALEQEGLVIGTTPTV